MGQVICSSCFEVEDTTKRFIELPYVCALCEKDSASDLAIEEDTYNSGVPCQSALDNLPPRTRCCFDPPCQSALDSVQADVYDQYAHNSDILDQFDADTEIINDLREQLDGAHAANASLTEELELARRWIGENY